MKSNCNLKNLFLSMFLLLFTFSCSTEDIAEQALPTEESSEELSAVSAKARKLRKTVSVIYVEVNNNDMRNVIAYSLSGGKPLFNIANIFAANINYSATERKAVLHFNSNVQRVLDNRNTQIKPLQDKGVKVCLSILGNHQGVGIANFTTRAKARDFAQQVANAVDTYGLDGVDLDDEFSKYGTNGQPGANKDSLIWLLQELRKLMPNKLITYYRIGESSRYLQVGRKKAGRYVDYAYQPFYGSYRSISVPGLGKGRLSAAAINVQQQSAATAVDFAKRTVNDKYGVYMMYNLDGTDRRAYFDQISKALYRKGTRLTGRLY